jgi:hypothetical protein
VPLFIGERRGQSGDWRACTWARWVLHRAHAHAERVEVEQGDGGQWVAATCSRRGWDSSGQGLVFVWLSEQHGGDALQQRPHGSRHVTSHAAQGAYSTRGDDSSLGAAHGRWQRQPCDRGHCSACRHAARPEHRSGVALSQCRGKKHGTVLHMVARGSMKRGGGQGELVWTSVSRGGRKRADDSSTGTGE